LPIYRVVTLSIKITRNYKGVLKPKIDFKAILDGTHSVISVRYKGINVIKVVVTDYIDNLVDN
jgi:hypothetical protein